MTDVDEIMLQINYLPKSISRDGKWITISADNWRKFVDRITSVNALPYVEEGPIGDNND